MSTLEEVVLKLDELESLKLADLQGLYHEQAAAKMGVSRQTFERILHKAHETIADALINGKALLIKGGDIMTNERTFLCSDCRHRWSIPYGTGRPQSCPNCKSMNIHRAPEESGPGRGKGRRNRGRCLRLGNPNE